jgi:hypothetical protein
VGRARCRRVEAGRLLPTRVIALLAVLAPLGLAGCSETPVSERFTVQAEGDRYFVRERRGWFSAMLPCKPELSQASFGSDKIRMMVAGCNHEGDVFTITFGRFKVPAGAAPSVDQIYDQMVRGMEARVSGPAGSLVKIDQVSLAGRSARHITYENVAGSGATAHVWLLWAEEQQAIYNIMQLGSRSPLEGQRIVRSMLVPSP